MRTIITLFAFILSFATVSPYTATAQLNILSTNPNVSNNNKTLTQDKGQPNTTYDRNGRGNGNPNLGNPNNGRPTGNNGNGHGHNNSGYGNGHGGGHGHHTGTGRPGRPNNNGHTGGTGHGHGHHPGNTHNGPGYGHGHHHHVAICAADFEDLYHMAAQFTSSFDRMDVLEKQIPRFHFNNCQIDRLAKLFTSSFDRMDIMEIAFHQSLEQNTYHRFTSLFTSSFDRRDLLAYIDQHMDHQH